MQKRIEPIGFANNRVSLLFFVNTPLDILSLLFPDEPKIGGSKQEINRFISFFSRLALSLHKITNIKQNK